MECPLQAARTRTLQMDVGAVERRGPGWVRLRLVATVAALLLLFRCREGVHVDDIIYVDEMIDRIV